MKNLFSSVVLNNILLEKVPSKCRRKSSKMSCKQYVENSFDGAFEFVCMEWKT